MPQTEGRDCPKQQKAESSRRAFSDWPEPPRRAEDRPKTDRGGPSPKVGGSQATGAFDKDGRQLTKPVSRLLHLTWPPPLHPSFNSFATTSHQPSAQQPLPSGFPSPSHPLSPTAPSLS